MNPSKNICSMFARWCKWGTIASSPVRHRQLNRSAELANNAWSGHCIVTQSQDHMSVVTTVKWSCVVGANWP